VVLTVLSQFSLLILELLHRRMSNMTIVLRTLRKLYKQTQAVTEAEMKIRSAAPMLLIAWESSTQKSIRAHLAWVGFRDCLGGQGDGEGTIILHQVVDRLFCRSVRISCDPFTSLENIHDSYKEC